MRRVKLTKAGAELAKVRVNAQLSRTELSKMVGVSADQLYLYETGKAVPKLLTITRFQQVLGDQVGQIWPQAARVVTPGGRLALLRLQAGLSQHQLASTVGVRPSTICSYELNINTPNKGTARRIAKRLGVSVSDIWGRLKLPDYSRNQGKPLPPKSFGSALRRLRQRAGLSQAELAFMARLPASSITRYETNKTKPSVRSLLKLARALGDGAEILYAMYGVPNEWQLPLAPETVGQNIKAARIRLGLSWSELARRVGCSPSWIRQLEVQTTPPRLSATLLNIAEVLRLPLTEIDSTVKNSDRFPGARIRTYRLRAGLSMAEVARRLNMSRQAIEQLEKSTTRYPEVYVPELAAIFGVSQDELRVRR